MAFHPSQLIDATLPHLRTPPHFPDVNTPLHGPNATRTSDSQPQPSAARISNHSQPHNTDFSWSSSSSTRGMNNDEEEDFDGDSTGIFSGSQPQADAGAIYLTLT